MKITNFELVNIVNALNSYTQKRLPQMISYAITKNLLTLNNDMVAYNKSLDKVIKDYEKYAIKNKDGEPVLMASGLPDVDEQYKESYVADINELLGIEIDVDLYTINEETFAYDDGDKYDALTPMEIVQLQSILCSEKGGD